VIDVENPLRSALFTDLYELTMAQAYDAEAMEAPAVFELFFRKLPKSRNFIMAAGLDDVLGYLESFYGRRVGGPRTDGGLSE
jgi:nicotinate phosphoribosyltransferase